MATPGAEANPYSSFGTTLEQFRNAMTSHVARRNLGLGLSDEQARAIAADPVLSEAWYTSWRNGAANSSPIAARTDDTASPRFAMNPGDGTDARAPLRRPDHWTESDRTPGPKLPPGDPSQLIDDWQRELPVRFNRPPGWPYPSQDWILQHIGLEMSDEWRPPGAPTDDPPGWTWWIPQEPVWTAWVTSRNGAAFSLPVARAVFGVLAGLALALSLAGWSLFLIFAIMGASVSGVWLLVSMANDRHFRKDPLGELRDNHLQVAERLKIGRPVGDGHTLGMADYWDSGSWFDEE